MKKVLIIALLTASLTSCVAVKEYEKVNLSDPDMTLAQKKLDRFETSYQVYREAASGRKCLE
jgi:uncharacterized protein DUF4266